MDKKVKTLQERLEEKATERADKLIREFMDVFQSHEFGQLMKVKGKDDKYYPIARDTGHERPFIMITSSTYESSVRLFHTEENCTINFTEARQQLIDKFINEETITLLSRIDELKDYVE